MLTTVSCFYEAMLDKLAVTWVDIVRLFGENGQFKLPDTVSVGQLFEHH